MKIKNAYSALNTLVALAIITLVATTVLNAGTSSLNTAKHISPTLMQKVAYNALNEATTQYIENLEVEEVEYQENGFNVIVKNDTVCNFTITVFTDKMKTTLNNCNRKGNKKLSIEYTEEV